MKNKLVLLISLSIIAALIGSCNSSYLLRSIYYNTPSIKDYEIFPERQIKNGNVHYKFPKDTGKFYADSINYQFSERFNVPGISDFEQFLKVTETTAFIILKNDTLVFEKYYNGYNRESINTSFSTSKAFASALVGIAIADGYIEGMNDPISKYLPEIKEKANETLTIKSLVTMSSGIAYDDESLFGDDAHSYYGTNLREYALDFSMNHEPGTRFQYNNINPLLLGIILERATGMPVAKYLETKIWQPIGAEYEASWSLDENGFEKMESGINARAIDFLKFGRLFLNKGRWNDMVIIPEMYVAESTTVDTTKNFLQNIYRELSYSYHWWIFNRYEGQDDYFAEGNLGQYIYVSPHTQTVIVRHGKEYGYNRWPEFFNKLTNHISGLPLSDNPFEITYNKLGLKYAIALADSLNVINFPQKISEYYLNLFGYKLLSEGNNEDAIAVFKLNVRLYPESFNVYDSLGEAYLANNQKEPALLNYRKSLELNPNNRNAENVINSLLE